MTDGFSFSDVARSYYSTTQLERLNAVTVGIAGAGGIGSNCALMLVRSGFRKLVLADFDRITPSNLNRQAYRAEDIGRMKVNTLAENCRGINPEINITIFPVRVAADTVRSIFDDCDVIVEAFDDPAAKALLFSAYITSEKLLVGASGIAGIGDSELIRVREVRNNCFIVGDEITAVSESNKPFAPRVMIAAAKMADIVLSWAVNTTGQG